MAEDDFDAMVQMSLWEKQLEVVRQLAEAHRTLTALAQQVSDAIPPPASRDHTDRILDQVQDDAPSHADYRPQEVRWHTWAGFRDDMRRLERKVSGKVSKMKFAVENPWPSMKTISRTMNAYGLEPKTWPPTAWPDDPPNGKQRL